MLHASRRRKAGFTDDFPIASKNPDGRDLLVSWEAYFRIQLKGYPYTFRRVLNEEADGFTLPDTRPETFDISWDPHGFNPSVGERKDPRDRDRIASEVRAARAARRQAQQEGDQHEPSAP